MSPRRLWCAALIIVIVALTVALCLGCLKRERLDDRFRPRADGAKFTDLKGDPIEEIVDTFVKLGVLDYAEGVFMPDKPLERGDFVKWLVRANNIYWRDQPKRWVRLAPVGTGSKWTYLDCMPHTPHFPYIQGMIDAGRPVGFEEPGGDYGYARNLTREQMILLRDGVELGPAAVTAPEQERDDYRVRLRSVFEDADLITEEYLPAVDADVREGGTIELGFPEVNLTPGEKGLLEPGKLVTRREAVRALSELGPRGGRTKPRSYKHALVLGPWPALTEEEAKALDAKTQAEVDAARGAFGHDHGH